MPSILVVLIELLVGLGGLAVTGSSLWKMFGSERTITVTNRKTGKSVTISPKAGAEEQQRLMDLV